jgi:hypothetical protein
MITISIDNRTHLAAWEKIMAKLKTKTKAPDSEEIEFKEALPSQQGDDDLKVAVVSAGL